MNALKFLSSLPALLGATGFVVYYILARRRGGDRITADIVSKLLQNIPGRLPEHPETLGRAALLALIEGDAQLRANVSHGLLIKRTGPSKAARSFVNFIEQPAFLHNKSPTVPLR